MPITAFGWLRTLSEAENFFGGVNRFFPLIQVNPWDDYCVTVSFITFAAFVRDKLYTNHGAPDVPTRGRNHPAPARLERR